MNLIIALMVWGGIVAGPVYFAYCKLFSGTLASEIRIKGKDGVFQPAAVALDPGMNPIQFHLGGKTESDVSIGSNAGWIAFELLDGKEKLTEGHATITSKGSTSNSSKSVLGTYMVPYAGRFSLQFSGSERGSNKPVYEPYLQIYRNAKIPDMRIVWSGLACFIVGLLLGGGQKTEQ